MLKFMLILMFIINDTALYLVYRTIIIFKYFQKKNVIGFLSDEYI